MTDLLKSEVRNVVPSDLSLLLIGIPSIDREHKLLLENMDLLVGNPHAHEPSEHITESLSRLTRQLIDHFTSEEAAMRDIGMPELNIAKHVDAHVEIVEQITRLSIELMQRKAVDTDQVVVAVRGWVVDHLLDYDLEICQHRLGH